MEDKVRPASGGTENRDPSSAESEHDKEEQWAEIKLN